MRRAQVTALKTQRNWTPAETRRRQDFRLLRYCNPVELRCAPARICLYPRSSSREATSIKSLRRWTARSAASTTSLITSDVSHLSPSGPPWNEIDQEEFFDSLSNAEDGRPIRGVGMTRPDDPSSVLALNTTGPVASETSMALR